MAEESSGVNRYAEINSHDAGVMRLNLGAQEVTLNQAADPAFAIDRAGEVLSNNISYYHGDMPKAVQAYNYGTGNVDDLVNQYGSDWLDHRDTVTGGNPTYYNDVKTILEKW